MDLPPLTYLRQDDTHRLIPARFSAGGSVLDRLADNPDELDAIFELDGATNERLLGEAGRLPGIGLHELVFGVSYAQIVNAAFTHPHPRGSRFNGPHRGVWYAAFSRKTCEAEVVFHRLQELAEINWREEEIAEYVDYLADFHAEFHDLHAKDLPASDFGSGAAAGGQHRAPDRRGGPSFTECLSHGSYTASQAFGAKLLQAGSTGIIYPSVRHATGTCIACFRPTLVMNVRQGVSLAIPLRLSQEKQGRKPRPRLLT
ncbi:MAG: RES family NAD+ phosphorylase [Acidobacteriaceae bacterium]